MKHIKNFRYFFLSIFLFAKVCNGQVLINEYSVSNYADFIDNFGEYEDWVELYNAGATPVNLTGYHLATKTTNLTKWTFGSGVTINPGGFLRVWASNKNVNTGPNLHTNFKLKQCQGDRIIFSNASSVILDSLTLKKTQITDSRGRTTNGASTWSVFDAPTPNTSNNGSIPYIRYTATPVMSLVQGFYSGAQVLTITCPDAGVTIKYTTDGTSPNSSGITYFTPLALATTSVIRAQATSTNPSFLPSFVDNNTFFISTTHSVNVVSVFGDDINTLLNGMQLNAESGLEYFNSTGVYKAESFGHSNKHGNDSWAYQQRGIDFICRDEFGYNDALKYQIFNSKPRAEFQRIMIKAAANDNYPFEGTPNSNFAGELGGAHIRDQYVHTVAQKAGMHVDARTWAPAVLYVNGKYWGVYDVREKVDDKDFTKYYYDSTEDSLQFLQTWGTTWAAYGGPQALSDWNAFNSFCAANSLTVPANYAYVDSKYNLKSLTDYVILNSYVVCSDWLNWNTAWWRGLNVKCDKQKWRYMLWDEDATFKHYINYTGLPDLSSAADPCDPSTLNNPGGQGHIPILNKLLLNPTFKQYYVMRYFDLINTGLSCKRMTDILDSMILVITPEMPGQIARWPLAGSSMTQWQSNVSALKTFIQERCDTITKLFNGCYNTTGPYTIKINVDPPNSGTVDFNSLKLSTFTWQGTYPGNLPNNLAAHPKTNYCFSHWTTKTHTLSPSMSDSIVSLLLSASDSIVAHFIYNPKPNVVPASANICIGGTVQLQASNGLNYSWSPSTGLSCTTCSNPIASPSVSTAYMVTSTASLTCKSSTAQMVNITTAPTLFAVASDTKICSGETSQLQVTNGNTYTWSPAAGLSCTTCSNPIASPTVSTNYSVSSTFTNGCASSTTQTISVVPNASASFTAISSGGSFPQTINVINTSSSTSVYYWSFGATTSTLTTPSFVVNAPGTYTLVLVAYGTNNCNDTLRSIIVVDDIIQPSITMPNIFTPNADGVNDFFYPAMVGFKEMTCLVYDRWGVLVYEFSSLTDKWSGENLRGKEANAGTYFYIFTGKDIYDKNYLRKGYVQLIR